MLNWRKMIIQAQTQMTLTWEMKIIKSNRIVKIEMRVEIWLIV